MSINLGLRHDRLLREQAAQMFEKGCGYRVTARRLGVSAATVREWQKMYRVIGKGGFLAMGVKQARYDYETKVAAAAAVVDGGMSKPEAMVRFGIVSATPLKQWCRLYRQGGASTQHNRQCCCRDPPPAWDSRHGRFAGLVIAQLGCLSRRI